MRVLKEDCNFYQMILILRETVYEYPGGLDPFKKIMCCYKYVRTKIDLFKITILNNFLYLIGNVFIINIKGQYFKNIPGNTVHGLLQYKINNDSIVYRLLQ